MRNCSIGLLTLILVILSSITALTSYADDQDTGHEVKRLTISAIQNEQTHELAKAVIRKAYKRIGIEVDFDDLPAKRALEWANAGKNDGDLARIAGTEKKFTNLIKISTPIIEFKGVAFTSKIDREIRSWQDLNGLSVGIIGGIRYSEIGTKGLDRIFAKDMTNLFRLLLSDHIDVAIAALEAGNVEMHRNFKDADIHIIGQPLYSAELFHFVHKRHKDIVPKIEAALLEMDKNGEKKSIRDKVLSEMLSR